MINLENVLAGKENIVISIDEMDTWAREGYALKYIEEYGEYMTEYSRDISWKMWSCITSISFYFKNDKLYMILDDAYTSLKKLDIPVKKYFNTQVELNVFKEIPYENSIMYVICSSYKEDGKKPLEYKRYYNLKDAINYIKKSVRRNNIFLSIESFEIQIYKYNPETDSYEYDSICTDWEIQEI